MGDDKGNTHPPETTPPETGTPDPKTSGTEPGPGYPPATMGGVDTLPGAHPSDLADHELCNPMGYCWVSPLPFGDRIVAMDGTPDGAVVVAVSTGGALIEYGGGSFRYDGPGSDVKVRAVHVENSGEVWAATSEGVFYRPRHWLRASDHVAHAIAGDHQGNIWIITGQQVLRGNASGWIDETPSNLWFKDVVTTEQGVWVLALEFIGRRTRCVPYHGVNGQWRRLPGPPEDYSAGGDSARLIAAGDNVYLNCGTGFFGRVGDVWEPISGPGWPSWGAADGTVLRADQIWRPEAGTIGTLPITPSAIWGTSPSDVWLGVDSGGVVHFDGTTPASLPFDAQGLEWSETPAELWAGAGAAWGSAENDVWRSPLEHFDGNTWTRISEVTAVAIDGSASENVWFALQAPEPLSLASNEPARLARWDGDTLHELQLPSDWDGYVLSVVRTFATDDTLVGGWKPNQSARLARYDGRHWTTLYEVSPLSTTYYPDIRFWVALDGNSSSDLWALAVDRLLYFDGAAWTTRLTPGSGQPLFQDLAVAGTNAYVLRRDGLFTLSSSDDEVRFEHYGYEALERVAATSEHLWIYDVGKRALRRRR